MPVYVEPKLLNYGANQHSGDDYNHVQIGSTGKDYIIARLQRDGKQELADQVNAGTS